MSPGDAIPPGVGPKGDSLPDLLAFFARAEFKAPVEAMLGLSALLLEDCASGPTERLRPDVEKLQASVRRLDAIVTDLLDTAWSGERMAQQDTASFASRLRHDLRTPITSILGYGEFLIEDLGGGIEGSSGLLGEILDAARRLLGQIDAMVALLDAAQQRGAAALAERPEIAEPMAAIRAVLSLPKIERPKPVGRILVAEDNDSTRDLLTRLLRREGHEVLAEEDGAKALRRLSTDVFDLALVDLIMPGLSGIDVLSRLKADASLDLPVIIISALDEIDSTVRCIEAGADDVLAKPINPVLLRARVGAAIERKLLRDRDRATTEQLRAEQSRSEALLRNVLPKSVVERLRLGETVIADQFDEATILFSDLVDFTAMAAGQEPASVLDLLNRIFSHFDRLADELGLEKVKTIGDAYMVAGGLPERRPDHARAAVAMALGMLAVVEEVGAELGRPLAVRIGIHTGPVAAGIIGRDKFIYDVWGDTVNVASRLEHHGQPGRIHVSAETLAALGSGFSGEPREPIEVKGRGLMSTFFVVQDQEKPATGCGT